MNQEEFEKKLDDMPDFVLSELAQHELSKLCKNGASSFIMSIPPRITDTDILFAELIKRFKIKTRDIENS